MILHPRSAWYAAASFGLLTFSFLAENVVSSALGQATSSSELPAPILPTNGAPAPFLENHPESAPPSLPAIEQPGFSLRPIPSPGDGPSSTTSPPSAAAVESPVFSASANESEDLADHLLVVYNRNDPESAELAAYYSSRRNIPVERVLGISCPTNEEITRDQYEETIRSPIVSYLSGKNWLTRQATQVQVHGHPVALLVATRNDIWAIVLMRGVPLKIAPDPSQESSMETQPEMQTNAAAVDSELALLPVFGLPKGGYVPNIFYEAKAPALRRAGADLARNIVLVTRLDGPTPKDVRRMIDDSLYAEKNRLAGLAVVDSRGITDVKSNYLLGDIWLRGARDELRQDGWTVKFDNKEQVIPATDPCNEVALYLGWYSGQAEGPWVVSPIRFVPGAIAYHLHSFSANTVRSATENWVGPLIAHGADATMGTVYEPYLPLTPHEDIFTRRLLAGDSFAEAAYACQVGLSWMVTVVGDPLYRPFAKSLEQAVAEAGTPHTDHDDWLILQQVRQDLVAGRLANTADALQRELAVPGAGAVAYEGLGDLLQKLHDPATAPAVEDAYQKALDGSTVPVDRIRVGLKLAQYYSNTGQDPQALAELDVLRELYPADAKRFGVPDLLVPTTTAPEVSPALALPPSKNESPPTSPPVPSPALPPAPQQKSGPE